MDVFSVAIGARRRRCFDRHPFHGVGHGDVGLLRPGAAAVAALLLLAELAYLAALRSRPPVGPFERVGGMLMG
jgi:hypothetical protein